MDSILQKMREACKEAKLQVRENAKLKDVTVNTKSGDFEFIWKDDDQ